MNLWAVSMVRDEMDVLPYTLTHLLNEGVDGIIIADNRSVDGTREWLDGFTARAPVPVFVVHDDEVAYYQSRKISEYYRRATVAGADWVIPFDADELWHSASGATLREVFARPSEADCLQARVFNYFPTSADPPDEPVPFRRITHLDPAGSVLAKTAVRAGIETLVIEQGNHLAHADRPLQNRTSDLVVAHFPWRGPEQFERKARNGAEAYAAVTDTGAVPLNQGEHWRGYGRMLAEGGPAALRAHYDKWFHDPDIDLVRRPAPWREFPPAQ